MYVCMYVCMYVLSGYERYQCNACNSQGKHVRQKYPVETKFNFVSRKQKELKMSLRQKITGDLHGSKSD